MSSWNIFAGWARKRACSPEEVQQAIDAHRDTKAMLLARLGDLQRRRREAAVAAVQGNAATTPLAVKQCRLAAVQSLDDELGRTAAQIANIEHDVLALESAVVVRTLSANTQRNAATLSSLVDVTSTAKSVSQLHSAKQDIARAADSFATTPKVRHASEAGGGGMWMPRTNEADLAEVDAGLARLSLLEDLEYASDTLASVGATGRAPRPRASGHSAGGDDDDDDVAVRVSALMRELNHA